ncbi:uncharacterized protein LOC144644046 [Oculina patagonica]
MMEPFCFPEIQDDKFLEKKKGKLTTKSKSRNSFAGRRAHHNALEQQRRGVIRGCFESLRKSVPTLASDDKKLSRSGILRETARYIKMTKERIAEHINDLEAIRLQNQLLSDEVDYLGCLHETPPLCEDFNGFTKTLIEGEEIKSSPADNMISENFLHHTTYHQQSFACVYDTDRDLLGGKESLEREMLNRKISTEEEFYVDVEGFVQSPFSVYGSSCI